MAELDQSHSGAPPERGVWLRSAESTWLDDLADRRGARERRVAHDLVELSRLDRGSEQALAETVDLAEVVRSVCGRYRHVAISGPDRVSAITDPRRLARVLALLLNNACLHGAPPVSVSYDATGITVTDAGPGIEDRVLMHATDPFVTGRRGPGRGVGLGLAIAARQATLLGGELMLANAAEGGAVARVILDAHAGAADAAHAA
jgi:signal transduction histidine kinase